MYTDGFLYMYVSASAAWLLLKTRRCQIPWGWTYRCYKPPCGCCKLKWGLQEGQLVLLTMHLSTLSRNLKGKSYLRAGEMFQLVKYLHEDLSSES